MMIFFFTFMLGVFFFYFWEWVYGFSIFFLCMFIFFGGGLSGFSFTDMKLGNVFCLDCFSFYLILLSFWVFSMVLLIGGFNYFGGFMILVLFGFLGVSFLASNLFWFYVFFECSMIPIFFLVMGWGSGEDRLFSAYYMFIYTMFSSLPFLLVVLIFDFFWGISSYDFFKYDMFGFNSFFIFFFVFVFMVKMPIFLFHVWLPKAHVDAPVYGSMILASVMLKLGGYGLFRVIDMFGWSLGVFNIFFIFGLCGMVFVSLICLYSVDMKVIAAYSSVVHMCVMVCGILSGYLLGYIGGFLMILSHGICSSGLFMMVNMLYERSFSRLLILNKGYIGVFPVFSFLWLFLIMDNIGAPPSLSFFSEVYCLSSIINQLVNCWVFIFLGLFVMSCVSMNLFLWGFGGWFGNSCSNLFVSEYFLVFFHLFPLNFMGLFLGCLF